MRPLNLLVCMLVTSVGIYLPIMLNVIIMYDGDGLPWHSIVEEVKAEQFTPNVVMEYPDIWEGL